MGLAAITYVVGPGSGAAGTGTLVLSRASATAAGTSITAMTGGSFPSAPARNASHEWMSGRLPTSTSAAAPEVQLNLTGSQEAVVLKDGMVIRGQILEVAHESNNDTSTPFLVIIRDSNGREQRLPVGRVGRVYFAGASTEATTGSGSSSTAGAAAGHRGQRQAAVDLDRPHGPARRDADIQHNG